MSELPPRLVTVQRFLLRSVEALQNQPARVFILLALVFGLLFIAQLAPLNGTDEFSHFPRLYQISQGTLWEQSLPMNQYGGYLTKNINAMVNDYRDLSRKGNPHHYSTLTQQLNARYSNITQPGRHLQAAVFTSIVIYPPWAYLASLPGLLLAKALAMPLIWYVYLARLTTLLAYIALVYWAIRLMPVGKWFLVTIALLPTSLSQAATIGADGLVTGLSWLLIAATLAIFAKRLTVTPFRLVLLTLGGLWLSVIKDGYWLIVAVPLCIPLEYFASRRKAWQWRISYAAVNFVAAVLFALRTSHVAKSTVLTPRLGVYINSQAQLHYVLHHTIVFLGNTLWQPFTKSYDTIYLGVVGILTNRLVYLSILIIGLLYGALYVSLIKTSPLVSFTKYRKRLLAVSCATIIGTYLLISLAFYIGNTAVGASSVFGIYGRYFLPVLPMLTVLPMVLRKPLLRPVPQWYVLAILAIIVVSLTDSVLSIT